MIASFKQEPADDRSLVFQPSSGGIIAQLDRHARNRHNCMQNQRCCSEGSDYAQSSMNQPTRFSHFMRAERDQPRISDNTTLLISNPWGVRIQLVDAIIQVAEINVPLTTIIVARSAVRSGPSE
jgi:hypothetical protein